MAISVTSIWNQALSNIGVTTQVSGPNDNSKAGILCNLWWDTARRGVLNWYPWRFAETTATLVLSTFTPPDYAYAYAVPNDCLTACELLSPAGRQPPGSLRIPWIIRRGLLLTDLAPGQTANLGLSGDPSWLPPIGLTTSTVLPCLRYTADITDPTLWSEQVGDAMGWQLAVYLAMPMTQQKALREMAKKEMEIARDQAVELDLNEEQRDQPRPSEPTQARE